jgi:hypothetical protein
LATTQSALYAGGQGSALALGPGAVVKRSVALKLDNHWDVEPPRGEG